MTAWINEQKEIKHVIARNEAISSGQAADLHNEIATLRSQ
jgi:hypothetical protein